MSSGTQMFFTSDHHHGHRNIIEYSNRPWSFEDQTEELIKRWNDRVGVMDDVYHLGDFSFKGPKHEDEVVEIINQLNGCIHFIRGNHDHKTLWKRIEDRNIPHVEWIKDYAEIKVNHRKVVLCHYAMRVWNNMHHGAYMLYGHSHGSLPGIGKSMDVGIDAHPEFQVYSWDEIDELLKQREVFSADHHN